MAYTFLNAQGQSTGKSLVEADKIEVAKAALEKAKAKGVRFLLPVDHVLADKFANDAKTGDSVGAWSVSCGDDGLWILGRSRLNCLNRRLPGRGR